MNTAIHIKQAVPVAAAKDFRTYLAKSLRDPFTINLKDLSLMDVIKA